VAPKLFATWDVPGILDYLTLDLFFNILIFIIIWSVAREPHTHIPLSDVVTTKDVFLVVGGLLLGRMKDFRPYGLSRILIWLPLILLGQVAVILGTEIAAHELDHRRFHIPSLWVGLIIGLSLVWGFLAAATTPTTQGSEFSDIRGRITKFRSEKAISGEAPGDP
jgi:hypothetical protein